MRALLLLAVLAIALAGCGDSDTPSAADTGTSDETTTTSSTQPAETTTSLPCKKPPPIAIENISFGLIRGGALTGAKYVEVPAADQNSQGWPHWLIAARIKGAVGIWATSRNGDGPIWAVDEVARTYTDWGVAAQPGSPARDAMDALLFSDAATAVVACVGG